MRLSHHDAPHAGSGRRPHGIHLRARRVQRGARSAAGDLPDDERAVRAAASRGGRPASRALRFQNRGAQPVGPGHHSRARGDGGGRHRAARGALRSGLRRDEVFAGADVDHGVARLAPSARERARGATAVRTGVRRRTFRRLRPLFGVGGLRVAFADHRDGAYGVFRGGALSTTRIYMCARPGSAPLRGGATVAHVRDGGGRGEEAPEMRAGVPILSERQEGHAEGVQERLGPNHSRRRHQIPTQLQRRRSEEFSRSARLQERATRYGQSAGVLVLMVEEEYEKIMRDYTELISSLIRRDRLALPAVRGLILYSPVSLAQIFFEHNKCGAVIQQTFIICDPYVA